MFIMTTKCLIQHVHNDVMSRNKNAGSDLKFKDFVATLHVTTVFLAFALS